MEINGDSHLNLCNRILYLCINAYRNILGARISPRFISWWPMSFEKCRTLDASPSRVLTEAFLIDKLNNIAPVKKLDILDVGCGSGSFSEIFSTAGYHGNYTGIDKADRFNLALKNNTKFNIEFSKCDVYEIDSNRKYDLIFSVSALEHFPNDKALIDKLRRLLKDNGIQIHIVPTGWSLPLYLWHGYRQYNKTSIIRKFIMKKMVVYKLGGMASWFCHLFWITIPEIILRINLRKRFSGYYRSMLQKSLFIDRYLPFMPTLYVICETTGQT